MTVQMPPDQSELWKGLRSAWLADPLIKQLIDQSAQGGSIYLEMPSAKVPFPLLTMKVLEPSIKTDATYLGISRETIQVNSYATDRFIGAKIFAALQQNWSIPITSPEFNTLNWRITRMQWSTPIDLGKVRVDNDQRDIWCFACECHFYLRRRDS